MLLLLRLLPKFSGRHVDKAMSTSVAVTEGEDSATIAAVCPIDALLT